MEKCKQYIHDFLQMFPESSRNQIINYLVVIGIDRLQLTTDNEHLNSDVMRNLAVGILQNKQQVFPDDKKTAIEYQLLRQINILKSQINKINQKYELKQLQQWNSEFKNIDSQNKVQTENSAIFLDYDSSQHEIKTSHRSHSQEVGQKDYETHKFYSPRISKQNNQIAPQITQTHPQPQQWRRNLQNTITKHHLDDCELKQIFQNEEKEIKVPQQNKKGSFRSNKSLEEYETSTEQNSGITHSQERANHFLNCPKDNQSAQFISPKSRESILSSIHRNSIISPQSRSSNYNSLLLNNDHQLTNSKEKRDFQSPGSLERTKSKSRFDSSESRQKSNKINSNNNRLVQIVKNYGHPPIIHQNSDTVLSQPNSNTNRICMGIAKSPPRPEKIQNRQQNTVQLLTQQSQQKAANKENHPNNNYNNSSTKQYIPEYLRNVKSKIIDDIRYHKEKSKMNENNRLAWEENWKIKQVEEEFDSTKNTFYSPQISNQQRQHTQPDRNQINQYNNEANHWNNAHQENLNYFQDVQTNEDYYNDPVTHELNKNYYRQFGQQKEVIHTDCPQNFDGYDEEEVYHYNENQNQIQNYYQNNLQQKYQYYNDKVAEGAIDEEDQFDQAHQNCFSPLQDRNNTNNVQTEGFLQRPNYVPKHYQNKYSLPPPPNNSNNYNHHQHQQQLKQQNPNMRQRSQVVQENEMSENRRFQEGEEVDFDQGNILETHSALDAANQSDRESQNFNNFRRDTYQQYENGGPLPNHMLLNKLMNNYYSGNSGSGHGGHGYEMAKESSGAPSSCGQGYRGTNNNSLDQYMSACFYEKGQFDADKNQFYKSKKISSISGINNNSNFGFNPGNLQGTYYQSSENQDSSGIIVNGGGHQKDSSFYSMNIYNNYSSSNTNQQNCNYLNIEPHHFQQLSSGTYTNNVTSLNNNEQFDNSQKINRNQGQMVDNEYLLRMKRASSDNHNILFQEKREPKYPKQNYSIGGPATWSQQQQQQQTQIKSNIHEMGHSQFDERKQFVNDTNEQNKSIQGEMLKSSKILMNSKHLNSSHPNQINEKSKVNFHNNQEKTTVKSGKNNILDIANSFLNSPLMQQLSSPPESRYENEQNSMKKKSSDEYDGRQRAQAAAVCEFDYNEHGLKPTDRDHKHRKSEIHEHNYQYDNQNQENLRDSMNQFSVQDSPKRVEQIKQKQSREMSMLKENYSIVQLNFFFSLSPSIQDSLTSSNFSMFAPNEQLKGFFQQEFFSNDPYNNQKTSSLSFRTSLQAQNLRNVKTHANSTQNQSEVFNQSQPFVA